MLVRNRNTPVASAQGCQSRGLLREDRDLRRGNCGAIWHSRDVQRSLHPTRVPRDTRGPRKNDENRQNRSCSHPSIENKVLGLEALAAVDRGAAATSVAGGVESR
jgi:hypothetical protein